MLPRADSPSADRYVKEREGQTAWTMRLEDGAEVAVPEEILAQVTCAEHVSYQFNPNARQEDLPVVNQVALRDERAKAASKEAEWSDRMTVDYE